MSTALITAGGLPAPAVPTLLTRKQVAEFLSVSIYVVEQLRRKGALPGVLVNGTSRRWHPDEVIVYQRNGDKA